MAKSRGCRTISASRSTSACKTAKKPNPSPIGSTPSPKSRLSSSLNLTACPSTTTNQWLQIERDRLALLAKKIEDAAKKSGPDFKPKTSGGIPPEVMAQVEKELRLL